MSRAHIGRNDPCSCGSGKKFKKCCLDKVDIPSQRTEDYSHVIDINRLGKPLRATGRPQISALYRGKRIRAVGARIYSRPPEETFHEFILTLLAPIFGGKWYEAEYKKDLKDRHVVAQWYYHFRIWQEKSTTRKKIGGLWSAVTDGPTQALMQLAYDVYLLMHCSSFPKPLMKRLRDRFAFQGVRYEIAVAAIFARLGYDIAWEDDKKSSRHCEFLATNPRSNDVIGVEAKSRRRGGVLHEPMKYDGPVKMKGDIGSLLNKALTQKPEGKPFIIFIDLNLPATASLEFVNKPWFGDVSSVINNLPTPTAESPDKSNAIIVTNFAGHYGSPGIDSPPEEYMLFVAKFAQDPLKNSTALTEIAGVLRDHNQIHDLEQVPRR